MLHDTGERDTIFNNKVILCKLKENCELLRNSGHHLAIRERDQIVHLGIPSSVVSWGDVLCLSRPCMHCFKHQPSGVSHSHGSSPSPKPGIPAPTRHLLSVTRSSFPDCRHPASPGHKAPGSFSCLTLFTRPAALQWITRSSPLPAAALSSPLSLPLPGHRLQPLST